MAQDESKAIMAGIVGLIALLVILVFVFGGWYTIQAGQRGIILTFGKADMVVKSEGLHFKMPLVQSIYKMDIKTQKYEADLTAASQDLQDVRTKIAINYHIIPESAPEIFTTIGMNYAEKVIYPLEQEINKGTTAQYTAEQLVTKREAVRAQMKSSLIEKLKPRGIVVEEVSIIDFAFSQSFTQAIEQKVTAEQLALSAKNKLEQIKYEAQQVVEAAKGKAEAITIEGNALRANQNVVQLRFIEKWGGQLPLVMGGNDINPFVSLGDISKNIGVTS